MSPAASPGYCQVVTQQPLHTLLARDQQPGRASCDLSQHDLFNLVAHTDKQQEGRVMWCVAV